ncbi:MAG: HIT family hydrolase [Candidatus Altiarchaeales archaeon ex4484_96]|nr:MAG: HIT family hydrolase [Candidatus Altiarchaeales archaeon ex4484_96]
MDCLFCKIAAGNISSEKIYETQDAMAFLDINPISKGHAVVIPKKHSQHLTQLNQDELGLLFDAVKQVSLMIEKGLNPDGFNIGVNQGKTAGQAIPHLHVHVIPRYLGDGGGSLHSIISNPPDESIEETARRLR